jgi:hypothetical protein
MAFSGQYAAAQLRHLPLPHSVIGELSDYLGYAPDFAPPTYVKWARVYGRLPDDSQDYCTCRVVDDESMNDRCCSTAVHWSDFRNKDFRTDYFGDCRVTGYVQHYFNGVCHSFRVEVTPERVRPALTSPSLHLPMFDDDREFFTCWSITGPGASPRCRHAWPYVPNGDPSDIEGIIHPAIAGAVRKYRQYIHWLHFGRR